MDAIFRRAERVFWFTLATLFLIENWLWDHVKEWLRLLAKALGVERVEAWLAAFVKGLSPPATLVVFAIPALMILPFKVVAVALFASGHYGSGLALILAAKTLGLGVTAFLFDLCRDKLLELAWFERLYRLVLRVRAWAHELVDPVRVRLRQWRAAVRAALFPYLARQGELTRRLQLVLAMTRRDRGA